MSYHAYEGGKKIDPFFQEYAKRAKDEADALEKRKHIPAAASLGEFFDIYKNMYESMGPPSRNPSLKGKFERLIYEYNNSEFDKNQG